MTRVDAGVAAALAALTLAIALYFAPRGFHAGFVDMGHDGYQLRQVVDLTQGGVIFRDTFDQYGPLNGYLNAVGFLAFGRRLLAIKYFICGWYAATAIVLFAIARRWLDVPLAAFSVLVWLGLAPFYNHGIMISPHAYALFFQGVATLIALRTPDLAPRRYAVVGLLAGLCWGVKQAMGVFYLAAVLAWLVARAAVRTADWRRASAAAASALAGFAAVVVTILALLWTQGAIHDWYLQTIVFPQAFYLSSSAPRGLLAVVWGVASFVQLQFSQPPFWIALRVVVLAAAVLRLRRRRDDDLMLMALLTAFLWLGAYPSGNFMHQWWTAGLTFAPFVLCVRRAASRWSSVERVVSWTTVLVIIVVAAPDLAVRAAAARTRARTLTERLTDPPLFRGIRSDESTKRAFETIYRRMLEYRAARPAVKVVSIESADGWASGMIESLPLLSFLEDNTHGHPVYWNLPVLSTVVYPSYRPALWEGVRGERPLIVDHRPGKFQPLRICAYRVLDAVRSDVGFWYLYAPEGYGVPYAVTAAPEGDDDDWMEYRCRDDGSGPTPSPPRPVRAGALRGVVAPLHRRNDPIHLSEPAPIALRDSSLGELERPVDIYTWPDDLTDAQVDAPMEPTSTNIVWRAGKGDIVNDVRPGTWTVNGSTKQPYGYLLEWGEQTIAAGTMLVVRGELVEGGLQLGFLQHDAWSAWVCITRPSQFEAVIRIPKSGRYTLVLANCIDAPLSSQPPRWSRAGLFSLLAGPSYRNNFHVRQAGWISGQRGNVNAGAVREAVGEQRP